MMRKLRNTPLLRTMLAVAMVAAISVSMAAAPTAKAAEERNVYFIGSTHNNADPSLISTDPTSPAGPNNNLFTSLDATQLASFGAHPITPLVAALDIMDAVDFADAQNFKLDEVYWDGTKYVDVDPNLTESLPIDVFSAEDAGYAYLQDNELAITLDPSELTTDAANAGLAFNPDTYYRLSFEFNVARELFVFKTKVPSGGGQQALVFNVGGVPMYPEDNREVPAEASRLLYSFTNEIPEVTQYDVSNSQYIHVLRFDGTGFVPVESLGETYTVTFHYPATMTPPGLELYEQWVAIQFVEVVLDPITEKPVLVPTDMVPNSIYKVVFDADDGSGTTGLSANNGNRLQNAVEAVFDTK